jgi:NET1-associated nuclear protein 1 (U3 small nucleolar RNA-associated protein 17)
MASQLKRKRDPVEVQGTPKRSKSVKSKSGNPINFNEKTGWEAAMRGQPAPKNGVNSGLENPPGTSSSPEAMDFEDFVGKNLEAGLEEEEEELGQTIPKRTSRGAIKEAQRKRKMESFEVKHKGRGRVKPWKLSESIGGRMIDVDPVFTADEKYAV